METSEFVAKWVASSAAERANKDLFLLDLCDVLGVPRPQPATGDRERDLYVFERDAVTPHEGGRATIGKIDLYKEGHFLLEAKQGSDEASKKIGTARRGTPAWNIAMRDAFGQALGYARTLDVPPPFLLTCDIGHCFDLYASFAGDGDYRPFPDAFSSRIYLTDLSKHLAMLRAVFLDPLSLDPARKAATVTREVASHLAELARDLEAAGNSPEDVATFLMRCLFTMFAEDVGLLPERLLSEALETQWLANPRKFPREIELLWRAMNDGLSFGYSALLRFNGGLFRHPRALQLTRPQLERLLEAARCAWSDVEPAIFGTLLERALDPKERHRLGAHYTPRAYVERLVRPTIEEPLREEWSVVQGEARQLVAAGKEEAARKNVRVFHQKLCRTRVLDPACGSGNFLYVALDLFKRLETEVLGLLKDLGERQERLDVAGAMVNPAQFLGIEVKRWAKEIADLVLWIGYLQWHFRTHGKAAPEEPVLRDYKNIDCRDAVLAYDRADVVLDGTGKAVTRWDGETYKPSPVTGEPIPDQTALAGDFRYVNPRPAEWPKADYIVGNPPYIGNWRMRSVLGEGYSEALRQVHADVPESSDYVMYFWNHAAALVRKGRARRFGFITTNSISQTYNRKVVQENIEAKKPLSLAFAVPDHPWVDSADGADVRISMTVGVAGKGEGLLATVESEKESANEGEVDVVLRTARGQIHSDLSVGANVVGAVALRANADLSCPGVKLHGAGFLVTSEQASKLGLGRIRGLDNHIRLYRNGKDLTASPRELLVIDLFGLPKDAVRDRFPAVYQWVFERVKPERDQNNRATYRENWWIFGEPRSDFRPALAGLDRFIATVETSKHRFFVFLDASVMPDNKLICMASNDAYHLGVLSSRIHVTWALAAGGRLGVGNDPVYVKSRCFEPFPFPDASGEHRARVRSLAEALDAHRKCRQEEHPDLSMTAMYNVLEKLRSSEPLSVKESAIHERGLVSVLRQLHDDVDVAVAEAYGWPADLNDAAILERVVALNAERAAEERQGRVRWLRPDYQLEAGKPEEVQPGIGLVDLDAVKPAVAAKKGWPKQLADQIAAVRDLLVRSGGSWSVAQVAAAFRATKRKEAQAILESLSALGVLVAYDSSDGKRWRRATR